MSRNLCKDNLVFPLLLWCPKCCALAGVCMINVLVSYQACGPLLSECCHGDFTLTSLVSLPSDDSPLGLQPTRLASKSGKAWKEVLQQVVKNAIYFTQRVFCELAQQKGPSCATADRRNVCRRWESRTRSDNSQIYTAFATILSG